MAIFKRIFFSFQVTMEMCLVRDTAINPSQLIWLLCPLLHDTVSIQPSGGPAPGQTSCSSWRKTPGARWWWPDKGWADMISNALQEELVNLDKKTNIMKLVWWCWEVVQLIWFPNYVLAGVIERYTERERVQSDVTLTGPIIQQTARPIRTSFLNIKS